MEAAVKCGVKKVVLTSSVAAITDHPVKKYTEEDWNKESSLTRNPYYYSKTLAEEAAWKFVNERPEAKNLKLVVINVRHYCPVTIHLASTHRLISVSFR
jgi:dihydroflavonol-4-reductase